MKQSRILESGISQLGTFSREQFSRVSDICEKNDISRCVEESAVLERAMQYLREL